MESKGGRPTKFKKEYVTIAHTLALMGATDVQMAEALDIDIATLYRWKNEHKEFCDAVKGGKLLADAKVASALYTRALGYNFDETTYENGVKKKVVKKHLPADVGAITMWLQNRQRNLWGRSEIDYSRLTEEQLNHIIETLKNSVNEKG